jgi:hypothetical protein
VIMMRTQISLTPEEMRAARAEAKRLGISLAELLRRSLWTLLPAEPSRPWMRYAGMIASGDARSSQRILGILAGERVPPVITPCDCGTATRRRRG